MVIFMLHNFRKLLEKIIPKRHFDRETSFYLANLFFEYEWKQITVDDLVPVSSKDTAFFTTTSTDEFWPILFEKALSKGIGSYLEASKITDLQKLLTIVTGSMCKKIFLSKEMDKPELVEKLIEFKSKGFPVFARALDHPGDRDLEKHAQ